MIDGVDFAVDEFGHEMVEMEDWYDEDDNLHRQWKDLDGEWHDEIIDAAADRGAEYYDGEYSDPYDD